MKEIPYHSRFSRNKCVPILMIIMGLYLLLFGIPIGVLLGIVTILEIISFSIDKLSDIFMMCFFTLIFLVIIPYAVLFLTHIIPQHQIRIYKSYVEFSYSGILFWKQSWRRFELKDFPYFLVDINNLSLVNKDLQYIGITIHSKSKYNIEQIQEARRQFKKLGLKGLTIEEWADMRKKKYLKGGNKEK